MSGNARSDTCEYLIKARLAAGYARREDAACYVPYSPTTIGRHERGEIDLMPRDVVLYADAYGAPMLGLQYCRSSCPIGIRAGLPLRGDQPLSIMALAMINRADQIAIDARQLARIAEDDKIDATERAEYDRIVGDLHDLAGLYQDLRIRAIKKPAPAADRLCGLSL